jgi:hypothetical protein
MVHGVPSRRPEKLGKRALCKEKNIAPHIELKGGRGKAGRSS